MSESLSDIHDKQIPNLINKLIRFLGSDQVDKAVRRYKYALNCSGPIYRDYYLKYRHPWWLGLSEYTELVKSGKAIYKNLTPSIEKIAGDAKKIIELQKYMPENILKNYKGNLLDDKRANDFLYELHIAWHYLLRGNNVIWSDSTKPQHEFSVVNEMLSFNVECKRISVDSFRKVKRGDFFKLVEILLPDIESRKLAGKVELIINDNLESSDSFIAKIKSFVLYTIDQGCTHGNYNNNMCTINLALSPANNIEVNMQQEYINMWKSKRHEDHGAIFARAQNNKPVDPIYFLCRSEKADHVLNGISKKLKDASNRQLDESKPGIISVYIEDIDDFSELASESGLQIMTSQFLASEKRKHIAAVIYSSDSKYRPDTTAKTYYSQGLIYKNHNCIFEKAVEYQYLS